MNLDKAAQLLLIKNPFYGLVLLNVKKYYSENVKTAAVHVQGLNFHLEVNKEFFDSLTDEQCVAILEHEVLHLVFKHVVNTLWNFDDHDLANMAMDMEINCYINGLPNGCILAENFGLEPKKGCLYYYNELKKILPPSGGNGGKGNNGDNGGNGKGKSKGKVIDDHSKWGKGKVSEAQGELISNQIDHIVKQTVENLGTKGRGSIPSFLDDYIKELFKVREQVFNWRAYVRRLLGTLIDINVKKTHRRESKRFSGAAGIRKKQKSKLLVAIDCSGSVSSDELKEFFSEIYHLYRTGTGVQVIEFDTAICGSFEYKGEQYTTRMCCGGTDFQCVYDYYNQHLGEYSSCVLFTDGGAPTEGLSTKKPVIWVISSNGDQDEKRYPGYYVPIPKQQSDN